MYHKDNCRVSGELVEQAKDAFERYKGDKQSLVERVRENMQFYQAAYAQLYNEKNNTTVPATAFILSAVENKYADYLDNFPQPNFLAREESDEETARLLSKIVPAQLEASGFKKAYKRNIRQKLICGTGIYGIFWNSHEQNIHIRSLDFMNVLCDMNVSDIEESRFVFVVSAVENERLRKMYPMYSDMFDGDAVFDGYEEQVEMKNCREIVDCYYKTVSGEVQLLKFCDGVVIDSTEDMDGFEKGLYMHGRYPIRFDVMYPAPKGPFGFGTVDIIKNPQRYIDILDGAILKNAMLASHPKWIAKKSANFNKEQLCDMRCEVVEADNVSEEHLRKIEIASVPQNVMQHRDKKIEELKEVSANRDFAQGGTTGGVTAASAITVLQEAGNKISRALIDDSYDVYKEIVTMTIELMRQFFDRDRVYRITGNDGKSTYRTFSQGNLTAASPVTDALGFVKYTEYRDLVFDIDVVPQRQNLYQRESQNQLFMQLWQSGFFAPGNIESALIVLKNMSFDGKEVLVQDLQKLQEKTQEQQAVVI